MPTLQETIKRIIDTQSWDQRVAQIRLIPQHHGTAEHQDIYATIAKKLYVPLLSPNFAYVHKATFYDHSFFEQAYAEAYKATAGFTRVTASELEAVLLEHPRALLVLRTITGLTRDEFAQSTTLEGEKHDLAALTPAKVDSMERKGIQATPLQARIAALTITAILKNDLFPHTQDKSLRSKQEKPDTEDGWRSVRKFAQDGVPFSTFLHQRHYGGSFRQILDATSTMRGNLLEEAVQALFESYSIPYIRTGSNNQSEIAKRFEITVTPVPDFVVYDDSGNLRAMLECKSVNDGGTARDKAMRFARLRDEAVRLGGVPLIAVLAGMGWNRVNDTLGPVVRDTDGRVFTLANLATMIEMAPFPSLTATPPK